MKITSSLEIFSLLELFQLIDSGAKSGKLTIKIPSNIKTPQGESIYYLWFDRGRLIAIDNNSPNSSLIASIEDRGWLKRRVIEKLENLCPPGVPLGNHLKNMGVLKTEQLQLLLQIKLEQIYYLFELPLDKFNVQVSFIKVNSATDLPWLEMTGIRVKARQVALYALRKLKNWEKLNGTIQLPETNSVLQRVVSQPDFQLDALELHIWKRANGTITLETAAKQLHQSLTNVQRATFRLIVAGVVEEVSESQAKIRATMTTKPLLSLSVVNKSLKSILEQLEAQPALLVQSIVHFALFVILFG